MLRSLFIVSLGLSSSCLYAADEVFDPASVSCALEASDFKKMYIGEKGNYEWKKGLAQISQSTGFFNVETLSPSGRNACQVELSQHQCLTMLMDENWEDKFGTNSGTFSCVNLRTGEAIPAGDLAYQNGVQERMIKMRCPHGTDISECSNDSNSKRGNDFRAQVLKANNLEMESVCAGYIREPRYFTGGKVGDRAMCALTNQQGEALYKVIIPMEYSHAQPLKKLDGTYVSYRPKEVSIDTSNLAASEALFMQETPLGDMVSGNSEEILATSMRCTSAMFGLMRGTEATVDEIEEVLNITTARISQWSATKGVLIPGDEGIDQATRLYNLAEYHLNQIASQQDAAMIQADTKSCVPLFQQTGLF
ncbi:hypothetical protein [Marinomonas algarum]|uniref:Uncharacterized protein n=1 Tax=Marinomonas algarum TaxID=2883105 RepID=A0A9X1IQR9_9GAMM|nr:hypothetical protein [Marinomonas algarum]MCB5162263.1 hypothetical protein [Marinomonas algarum]